VGDETAAFAVTPARLGLPYSASGVQYFLARLPLNVVNELLMTADLISAERALGVGILNRLVPEDTLETETYELARRVRSRSGEAIRAYKLQATAMVRAVALSAQDSQWINQLRHDVYSGADYAEGIAAFKEKRPPEFD
jgi:methylmalonyl-CoA decarboxylase